MTRNRCEVHAASLDEAGGSTSDVERSTRDRCEVHAPSLDEAGTAERSR